MKKFLVFGVGGVLVLALVAYLVLQFFLGSMVKAGVNKFGPAITQTNVAMEGANLSPLTGAGTLTGIAVANPQGWSNNNAFYLGKVHVDMEPFSVFDDHIVINEIVIDQPEFRYETKLVSSNIRDLLNNIESALGSEKGNEPKTEKGKPLKLEVKRFVLRNGRVSVGVPGAASITMPMPPIELTNIGTEEGGVTPAGLAFAVMRSVTASVVAASTEALGQIGGTTGAAAAEAAKSAGEAIKGFFGGKKK